jgi:hypothetical protein
MATGFLILHGVENHRPPEHWQFLLFHAAGRGADGAVERRLLVSPPASERVPDRAASFRLDSFDAEAVHQGRSRSPARMRSLQPHGCPVPLWRGARCPHHDRRDTSCPTPATDRGRSRPGGASALSRRHDDAVLGALPSQSHVARSASGRLRPAGGRRRGGRACLAVLEGMVDTLGGEYGPFLGHARAALQRQLQMSGRDRVGIGALVGRDGCQARRGRYRLVSAKEQVLMPGSPAPDVQGPSLPDVEQGIVNEVGEREQ